MTLLKRLVLFSFILVAQFADAENGAFIAPLAKESVLLDIAVADYAVAVGERGHVLVAIDSEDFVQVPTPTQSTLTSVAIVGDSIWAAGHDAVIIYSSDRGQSWQLQFSAPELDRPFLDITFFNENHGIAIGAYGLFYRTEDGGKSWVAERHAELLDPADQEYLEELRAESEQYYIQELDSILPHLNRFTLFENQLVLVGESGLIASSSDFGKSWQRKSINYYGSFFDVIGMQSPALGYLAVGLRGNAYFSDNGEQWQALQTCTNTTLNSLTRISESKLLAVGNNGVLVEFALPLDEAIQASSTDCSTLSTVSVIQTEDKLAVLAVAELFDKYIAVTANGLSTIQPR